jgi:hypothetical protein
MSRREQQVRGTHGSPTERCGGTSVIGTQPCDSHTTGTHSPHAGGVPRCSGPSRAVRLTHHRHPLTTRRRGTSVLGTQPCRATHTPPAPTHHTQEGYLGARNPAVPCDSHTTGTHSPHAGGVPRCSEPSRAVRLTHHRHPLTTRRRRRTARSGARGCGTPCSSTPWPRVSTYVSYQRCYLRVAYALVTDFTAGLRLTDTYG